MAGERRAAAAYRKSEGASARRIWARGLACIVATCAAAAVLPAHSRAQAPEAELAPAAAGSWQTLPPMPSGFNAVHLVAGPAGKVLLVAGSGLNRVSFLAGKFRSYV